MALWSSSILMQKKRKMWAKLQQNCSSRNDICARISRPGGEAPSGTAGCVANPRWHISLDRLCIKHGKYKENVESRALNDWKQPQKSTNKTQQFLVLSPSTCLTYTISNTLQYFQLNRNLNTRQNNSRTIYNSTPRNVCALCGATPISPRAKTHHPAQPGESSLY